MKQIYIKILRYFRCTSLCFFFTILGGCDKNDPETEPTEPEEPQDIVEQTPWIHDTPWPFDMPSTATLRTSEKKVFAHYFTQFPISIDNKQPSEDYYETGYGYMARKWESQEKE